MTGIADEEAWLKCNVAPVARTIGSIKEEAGRLVGKPNFSVKRPPIASLPADINCPIIEGVPLDALHARMRIGDKLVEGSVDISSKFTGDPLAKGFEQLVQSLGVRFSINETVVHGKVKVKHSSMTGVNWRKLFARIGPAIRSSSGIFPEDIKGKLASLFEDFHALLSFAGKCTKSDAEEVARKANVWAQAYVSMGLTITPYVHMISVHLAHTVKLFGGVDKLSGEWVEAANDDIKRTHMRKTDRRTPKMTLQTQLRIELQEAETKLEAHLHGQKRKRKVQNPGQGEEMKEREKKKRLEEEQERSAATRAIQSPYANLSVPELREVIFTKTGQRTRKQTKQGLIDILNSIA